MTNKKIKVTKTQEELQEEQLQRNLVELRKKLYIIPEPTYKFNLGDEVSIGNLKDVIIEEVLDNGKIYKIDYTTINSNYGKPIKNEHNKMYVSWIDIRKLEINKDSLEVNKDIILRYSQRQLSDLLGKVYHFGVDFEPDYQRDYVWELEDKIALIDSIFNNVDIGKFVFIFKGYSSDYMYEILDGKQRLRAICNFYEDRFQYKGKYYSDLSYKDQYHFTGYTINIAELEELTKEQILRYFIMVNTTGKVMAKEQIDKVRNMLKEY